MQRLLTILGPIPFMALAILAAGCALDVAIFVFQLLSVQIAGVTSWLRYPLLGVIVATSYFAYGLSFLLIAPAINFVLGGTSAAVSRFGGIAGSDALVCALHDDVGGALFVSGVCHAIGVCDAV